MEKKDYRVLLFYKYVTIEEPEEFAASHLEFCKETGLKGKPLFMGLRVVGTHQTHGPDLISALYLTGRDVLENRLKDYVK